MNKTFLKLIQDVSGRPLPLTKIPFVQAFKPHLEVDVD